MSKARFPIGQMTTSYDGCCGVLFRERKGDVHCIKSSLQSIILDQAAAAQILGCGAGEKISGKVGRWESREIAISEISRFFMDFLL